MNFCNKCEYLISTPHNKDYGCNKIEEGNVKVIKVSTVSNKFSYEERLKFEKVKTPVWCPLLSKRYRMIQVA